MNIETILHETESGVMLRNRLWMGDDSSDTLMIMFPGRGYTINHPLLHFLAEVGVQNGIDVFGLQYPFQATGTDLDRSDIPALRRDMQVIVDGFLAERSYEQIVAAGKSLGTPLAAQLALQEDDRVCACIQLTPIMDALPASLQIPLLAVIGTGDPFFPAVEPDIQAPAENIRWHVVDEANHGLEVSDWRMTVDILRDVMAVCESFLQEHVTK